MQTLNRYGHYWSYCGHCQEPIVICGNCGNNCCNGGSGEYADGSKCQICDDAYDFQDLGLGDNPVINLANRPEPTNPNRFILDDRAWTSAGIGRGGPISRVFCGVYGGRSR